MTTTRIGRRRQHRRHKRRANARRAKREINLMYLSCAIDHLRAGVKTAAIVRGIACNQGETDTCGAMGSLYDTDIRGGFLAQHEPRDRDDFVRDLRSLGLGSKKQKPKGKSEAAHKEAGELAKADQPWRDR